MSSSKASPPAGSGDWKFQTGIRFRDFAGQTALIEKLATDFQSGQFVHAYLFAGPEGVGKRTLARLCLQTLYCQSAEKPCGLCDGCRRVAAGNHSDVHMLSPEGSSISIAKIRELIETISMRPFEGGHKAVVIESAQRMTTQAQNCLLKTLETPPGDTVFFLLSEAQSALLPTILSRCRVVTLRPLSPELLARRLLAHGIGEADARALASVAQGSVGRALRLCADEKRMRERTAVLETFFAAQGTQDVVRGAAPFKGEREEADRALSILQEAVSEALRYRLCGAAPPRALYPQPWWTWSEEASPGAMLSLADALVRARKMLASNVQTQMVLETILLTITEERHGTGNRHSV